MHAHFLGAGYILVCPCRTQLLRLHMSKLFAAWCYTSTSSEYQPSTSPISMGKASPRQVATLYFLSRSTAPGHIATTGEEEHQCSPNSNPTSKGLSQACSWHNTALQHGHLGSKRGVLAHPPEAQQLQLLQRAAPHVLCSALSILYWFIRFWLAWIIWSPVKLVHFSR